MAGGYHGLGKMKVFFGSGSPHPHLAVHQHGEEPVAEGGEFLVLLVVVDDLSEDRLRNCLDFGFWNGREDFLTANGREMGKFFDHGFHGWARMEETWQFILIRENP
jgi:hypothetical protein